MTTTRRVALTQKEVQALLAVVSLAEAGELYEAMNRDGRAVAALHRAQDKLRRLYYSASP